MDRWIRPPVFERRVAFFAGCVVILIPGEMSWSGMVSISQFDPLRVQGPIVMPVPDLAQNDGFPLNTGSSTGIQFHKMANRI
jgi:hypothetical protein